METGERSNEDVQVIVGKDQSTVTFGGAKIEVSADGKKVTAYAGDGVEIKSASDGEATDKGAEFSVSKDFNTVVLNGVTIERAADGHLVISAPGTVIIKPGPANANHESKSAKAELEVGDKMEDGTIFAGVSPKTDRNMFVTPQDASGTLNWKSAMKFAADLDANGYKDWKLPSKAELNLLFENRAKIGSFDEKGSRRAVWYWSSKESSLKRGGAWIQRFSDGHRYWGNKDDYASVRAVRLEPRPKV